MTAKRKDDTHKLQLELEDARHKHLRALADYQNLEKRISQLTNEARSTTQRDLLVRFLDIADHLEKAEMFIQDKGLKMIKEDFFRIFNELGVKEMDLVGKIYDPYLAEAVEVIQGDEDSVVKEVVKKGYMIGDKVLRPAHVKVTKKIDINN